MPPCDLANRICPSLVIQVSILVLVDAALRPMWSGLYAYPPDGVSILVLVDAALRLL